MIIESPPGAAYHNDDDHVPRIQVQWPAGGRNPLGGPHRARAPGRTMPASDTGPGPRAELCHPPSRTRDAGDADSAAGRTTDSDSDRPWHCQAA
jgi:hypothetical protein